MPQSEVIICVLTYNRPAFLAQALRSILAQTWRDLRVVILDNASTTDYAPVIAEFQDERVAYVRHEKNLGSTGNLAHACQHFMTAPFFMAFHDDDLMHPELIERQVRQLQAQPRICWVSCLLQAFQGEPSAFESKLTNAVMFFDSRAELAEALMCGLQLNFGAVLYRSSALRKVDLQLLIDQCSIIADRPILFHAMRHGGAAILIDRLLLYREHLTQDSWTGYLRPRHLIGLAQQYQSALDEAPTLLRRWRFRFWCALNLPASYFRLPPPVQSAFWPFVRQCRESGVLHRSLLVWFPVRQALGYIVRKLLRRGSTAPVIIRRREET